MQERLDRLGVGRPEGVRARLGVRMGLSLLRWHIGEETRPRHAEGLHPPFGLIELSDQDLRLGPILGQEFCRDEAACAFASQDRLWDALSPQYVSALHPPERTPRVVDADGY